MQANVRSTSVFFTHKQREQREQSTKFKCDPAPVHGDESNQQSGARTQEIFDIINVSAAAAGWTFDAHQFIVGAHTHSHTHICTSCLQKTEDSNTRKIKI